MSSRGEAGRGARGHSESHGITDAKIEVKAEESSKGSDSGCKGKVLLGQLLEDESLGREAGEWGQAPEG